MEDAMDFLTCRIEYAIPIQPEELIALDKYESPLRPEWSGEKSLSTLLDEIPGVDRSDYNGHFGAYIHVRIDSDYDISSTRDKIRALIHQNIKKAVDWYNSERE
jgi:hypothetical protein